LTASHALRIARVVQETADARSFVLQIPAALRETFRYRAGQFLTFEVPWGDTMLGRCYSLSSSPECDAEHVVTVKRVAEGRVSNWFHDALHEGALVRVAPPAGRFLLRPASERPLALFSAGSGITPVISILKTALATTARRAKLVYANRDRDSIIFRTALEALAARHRERLSLLHHLDVEHGFLDREGVRRAVAGLENAEFYLCGPAPFMEVVEQTLLDLGVERDRIAIERFNLATSHGPEEQVRANTGHGIGEDVALTVHIDGGIHQVACAAGETVLEAVRRAGLSPPSACEDGYCGCCMARLLRGRVEMARCHALDEDEVADGWILTCQSRPATPECEVRYDE
jgi:3-ketosteroid 9alpha-monooxygenase subunit B